MAMLDFLKKKKEEEEKTDIKQEVQIPEPQESEKMLTELPEFPTMAEEDFSPLPKIESLSELEKSEIKIPLLGETAVKKPVIYPEKNMAPEFGELKKEVEEQEIEKEIELPPELGEEFEEPRSREEFEPLVSLKEEAEKRFVPKKIKTAEKRTFSPKKPVFVNVKSYQEISNGINLVTNILENSEEVVKRLDNIKIREDNELKKMYDSLDGLNKKIIAVDDILSKG
ncbi:MAG: hypothetical protein KKA61_01960 [Nanoarchaeota archaeon]|nr:hypothetical protein [Nanoarchaeota archaeon]